MKEKESGLPTEKNFLTMRLSRASSGVGFRAAGLGASERREDGFMEGNSELDTWFHATKKTTHPSTLLLF